MGRKLTYGRRLSNIFANVTMAVMLLDEGMIDLNLDPKSCYSIDDFNAQLAREGVDTPFENMGELISFFDGIRTMLKAHDMIEEEYSELKAKKASAKRKIAPVFTAIASNEVRLDYRGKTFYLKESDRGFYGAGRSVGLFVTNGFERKLLKGIGWTKPDSQPRFDDDLLKGIVTMQDCKIAAIKYIDSIM